jgi:Ni/Fe-hydrogenase subunit HybB-like protein
MVIRQKSFPKWAFIGVGAAVFLIALAVETNLGALFAAVPSKPLWNNPILPLHFIITALMAGACAHILFTSASKRRGNMPAETAGLFTRDYRPMLVGLVIINFAVIAIKFIPELMSSATFWGLEIAIGGLIPLAILFSRKGKSMGWLSAASAMILLGIFFSKYDLIIGGQSLGPTFTSSFISYFPSVYEILTVVGGLALSLLVYTVGHYILPLEPEKQAAWFIFSRGPASEKKLAPET